ncbi:MAG: amino acid--tRNA ligase-related protein, partial [bacterium]
MTELTHADRIAKLEAMRDQGRDPYPARGLADATPLAELHAGAGTPDEPGPLLGQRVTATGRLLGLRDFGKLVFAPLRDRTGRLQLGLKRNDLEDWWPERKWLDGGDLIGVRGKLGHTQKGEPTIWVDEVHQLAKALAPPPEKWHGMVDTEARYRRRYVDLWANPDVLDVFIARGRILSTLRRTLEDQGYIEVETPTLHPIAGGAAAKP